MNTSTEAEKPPSASNQTEQTKAQTELITRYEAEKQLKNAGSPADIMLDAARHGLVQVVRFLYNPSTSLYYENNLGENIFHFAARGGNIEMINYLIENYVEPNIANKLGETPLMYAAEEGHLDAIKILVEQKSVAVDDYDLFGDNMLHYAAKEGRIDVIKFVMEKFPWLSEKKNNKGQTPYHYAKDSLYEEKTAKLLNRGEESPEKRN